jgi:hypothetical protein
MAMYERGPRYMGAKLYNILPAEYKDMNNVRFRAAIKRDLLKGAFYSIEEFTAHHSCK